MGGMGVWVYHAARRNNGGCYGILEGEYNHAVLGKNVLAFSMACEATGELRDLSPLDIPLMNRYDVQHH